MRRLVMLAALTLLALGAVACSRGGTDTTASIGLAPEPTLEGGMRTIPTVPSSDALGETDTAGVDGAAADVPPSTLYVGDVQPDPDGADQLPPPPPNPDQNPDGCARLADFNAAGIVGTAAATQAVTESIWDGACRITAGPIVAEVHFIPEAAVLDDWYRRDGIEPVGDVSGDAVGLGEFLAPGSAASGGYTIALVSAREGVVIAVRGGASPRDVAVDLALVASQAG